MKLWKMISVITALAAISIPLAACGAKAGATTASQSQTATVRRGDLVTAINATGNLAFSQRNDLVFRVSGQVSELNVKVGDSITEGKVLARLDTTDLEQAVTTADLAVKSSQIDFETAQQSQSKIRDQETAVKTSEIDLDVAKQAQVNNVKSAQMDLETATNTLSKLTFPYTYSTFVLDVPTAIVAINDAQRQLDEASIGLQAGPGSPDYGSALDKFRKAQNNLAIAQERLLKGQNIQTFVENTSGGPSYTLDPTTGLPVPNPGAPRAMGDIWTVRSAQMAVEKAQMTLDNTTNSTRVSVEKAAITLDKARSTLEDTKSSVKTSLDKATVNLETAKNNLKKAQDNLAKAVILAPYNGIATAVNITGGQQVNSGQVAIAVADPAKLEADALVNEVDIPWVSVGGNATLQVDAASAINLPAKVIKISPTATVQSGVVNYTVTIEVQTTSITSQGREGLARTPAQSGQPSSGQTGQNRASGPSRAQSNMPSSIQLRQGLSVTANIIKEQRRGVLLISSRAITQQGGNSTVQVSRDGVIEQRIIKTGLTDGQNTEVTEGLSEGELVIIPARTTTTTTPQQGPGGGMPFRVIR
ncbi:MAG: HlyD family efflux transporter periplasmic adaptor subunit [Chloroflexi bacterium]|nr:HlyD family efflux transporter periplasmic adaptor subunit [Chloroflexota bacterium]